MSILVFPANTPEGRAFATVAAAQGAVVVGASSVLSNEWKTDPFVAWECLPFISDTSFFGELERVVMAHNITGIFASHPVVWQVLNEHLPDSLPGVTLLNPHPFDMALSPVRSASSQAHNVPWWLEGLDIANPGFPDWFKTALMLAGNSIPGQCSLEKLSLLATLLSSAPPGDIVEIGSLWGRSAYALCMVAKYCEVGPVLCVDPWRRWSYDQPHSSQLLGAVVARIDPEEAHRCFLAQLSCFRGAWCNYLRMTSEEAIAIYRRQRKVTSTCYGATDICGGIAFLHIDGNHDFEAVRTDLELWTPHILPGGWIVLDD